MNLTFDPSRHKPEVGRVLARMKHLIESGQRTRQDVVGALTEAIEFVAKEDRVEYDAIKKIVFGAMSAEKGN